MIYYNDSFGMWIVFTLINYFKVVYRDNNNTNTKLLKGCMWTILYITQQHNTIKSHAMF